MKVTVDDIPHIALGSTFFATGGGGDPLLGKLAATRALEEYGDVVLLAPEDIDDNAVVIAVGGVGAPSVAIEKLLNEDSFSKCLEELERYIGKKADAIIPFEMGGGNTLMPLISAARRGLPVLDADGMGRAFPESQMMTFCIYGVPTCPASLVDEFGNFVIVQASDEQAQEKISRAVALSMGGIATSASNVMNGKTARKVSVLHTYSLALKVGQLLEECRGQLDVFLKALQPLVNGSGYGEVRHLFSGKIVDTSSKVDKGWDVGNAKIESFTGDRNLRIVYKNEFLIAEDENGPVALTPDLIIVVDHETLVPITAERLRFGQRVSVIGIGAPSLYMTPEGIAAAGPRAFGFDQDYIRLVDLK